MTQQQARENNGPARREEEEPRPCPPLTDPNEARTIAEEAAEHVRNVTSPALEAELPRIHEARHFQDEESRIHVEALSPAWGLPPSLSLTVGPDGYAETRRLGYVDQDFTLHLQKSYQHDIVDHLRDLLFNRPVREMGPRKTAIIAASDGSKTLYHRMHTEASGLVDRLTVPMPDTDLPVPRNTSDRKQPDGAAAAAVHLMFDMLGPAGQKNTPYLALVARRASEHNRRMGLDEHREEQPVGAEPGQPGEDPNTFNERVLAEAARRAGAEAPIWTPIRHRRDPGSGASVIEVMFNDANQPACRISRMSNGTINVEPPGEHRAKFNFNSTEPAARAIRQNKEIILRHVIELHPNPAAAIAQRDSRTKVISQARRIADPAEPFLTQAVSGDRVEHPAREMLDRNLRRPELPESPRTRPATIQGLPGLITRAVHRSLVTTGPTNFPRRQRRNQNGDRDTVHYNIIAANQAVMDQIPPSSQAAVHYFQAVLAPLCDRMVRFQHPGQIIRTVQRHLDMEPDLWRWCLRTGENIVYEEDADGNRVRASLQARLLRDANRPDAHPLRISTVMTHLYNTRTVRFMPMDSTDPWNAWVRAVNLYLAPDGPPTFEENADLTHIGDAIRHQAGSMEPQPWPAEPWARMVERAERTIQRDSRAQPQNHLAWDSALGTVELDGFGFVPATTSAELLHWGEVMRNCLVSYDTACAHRGHRIFIVHSNDGRPVATLELEQQQGVWQKRQMEGRGRTRVSKEIAAAAARLAQQYERAARRRRGGMIPRRRLEENSTGTIPQIWGDAAGMPTTREIRETVRSIKRHVRNDDGYLDSEERTRHVLIDPILRALGWNTGDPSRVKIEFRKRGTRKRPDYALFRQGPRLVGLVEAKILTPEQIARLKERIRRHDSNIITGFEWMRSPNAAIQQAGREILFGPEEWAALRKANEDQLEEYVREFNMTSGYGILTNGDEWRIYDLERYTTGPEKNGMTVALSSETSVLFDDQEKATETLEAIRYDRKWPSAEQRQERWKGQPGF